MGVADPFAGLGAEPETTGSGQDPFSGLGAVPISASESATAANPFAGLGAEPAVGSEYGRVKKISDRHFWEAPLLGTEVTTDKELGAIAEKHGVDLDTLKSAAPLWGARTERESEEMGAGIGAAAGRSLLAGIPQFLAKKSIDDPALRAALDDVRELADAKRSLLQAGAEMLTPGGAVSRIGKGFRGLQAGAAATGAVYGLTGSREGEETSGAIMGAGLGTVLGTGAALISHRLAKVATREEASLAPAAVREGAAERAVEIEKGSREILQERKSRNDIRREYMETGEASPELLHRAERALPEDVVKSVPAEQLTGVVAADLRDSAIDFANRISKEVAGGEVKTISQAMEVLDKFKKNIGEENLSRALTSWEKEQAGAEYLTRRELQVGPDIYGGLARPLEFMQDAQFVLRAADEKAGTNTYGAHLQLNDRLNRSTFARSAMETKVSRLSRETEKAGLNPSTVTEMVEKNQPTPPDAADVVQKWRDLFNEFRDLAYTGDPGIGVAPLPIRFRENYVPHHTLDTPEFVVAVRRKINEMQDWTRQNMGGKSLGQLSDAEIQALDSKSPEFSEFLAGITHLDNNVVRTQPQLQNAMMRAQQPAVVRDLQNLKAASPTFMREDKIPDWIREKDIRKLAGQWANSTIRYMYIREPVQELKSQARLLRKAGAERQANYVDTLVKDLTGVRSGTPAGALGAVGNKIRIAALGAADKLPEGSTGRGFYETLAAIPDFLSNITHVIYPNSLGLNPRAILRNLPQTLVMTAPELGGTYGYKLALRGYVDAAANLGKLEKEVQRLGLAPERYTAEARDYIRRGLQQSKIYRMTDQALERASNALMYLYEKSDTVNRAATLSLAKRWAGDLVGKDAGAVAALRRAPTSIQRNALPLIAAGREDDLTHLLGSHLNASTQFNYNRASLSEYGRTMGPLFSTFTKWPMSMLGDAVSTLQRKGILGGTSRLAQKYLLPITAAGMLQRVLFGPSEDMSDREKKLVGAAGLIDWMPGMAIKDMLTGGIMTPPAMDVAVKVLTAATRPDAEMSDVGHNAAAAITQSFVPGAGLLRFFTDDAVTLMTGRRPEGNFLERTEEGAKRLVR